MNFLFFETKKTNNNENKNPNAEIIHDKIKPKPEKVMYSATGNIIGNKYTKHIVNKTVPVFVDITTTLPTSTSYPQYASTSTTEF